MTTTLRAAGFAAACAALTVAALSADTTATAKKGRPQTRLFVQDLAGATLRTIDVRSAGKDAVAVEAAAPVEGFPKLDAAKQKLVQMKALDGVLCVGVRDEEKGTFQSGWVVIDTGARWTDHGDHGHWGYPHAAKVIDSRLDAKQGNPAHLYTYSGKFFVANDALNGYTRIDPKPYLEGKKDSPRFLVGGGNHITLAVADDKVGYSAWIDGGGPNKGRVDVTPVGTGAKSEPAYSFHLPTGGIHGATVNSGRAFFAPLDGICWVDVDASLKGAKDTVKVHHIPLGKDGDKPLRAGAFADYKHNVVFTTGKGEAGRLVVIDAKKPDAKPVALPLGVKAGTSAVTPHVIAKPDGGAMAFVFHDRTPGSEARESLQIIDLDPNGDGNCADAKIVKTIEVGKSDIDGHFGHHDVAADADGRYAYISNPGDGTISVLSLKTLEVVTTAKVGGKPAAVVAVGGRESAH